MASRRSETLVAVGVVLVFASMILYRGIRFTGGWSIDWRDTVHWYGIIGAVLFAASMALSHRSFRASLKGNWAKYHCLLGALSLIFAGLHSRSRAAVIFPVHYSSYFILAVMGVTVLSGVLFRVLPPTHPVVRWLRLLHSPLSSALKLALLYHVLTKLAVI
ncbi:hypothetical protein JXL21_03265 [Candidatus Bathyarchaeota archaeon]|nr:hypothetical protein [Candidatus Bathyarchaeota archaeon]